MATNFYYMANKPTKTAKKAVKKTIKKAAPKKIKKAMKKAIPKKAPSPPVKKAGPQKAAEKVVKKPVTAMAPLIQMAKPAPAKPVTRGLLRGEAPPAEKTTLDTLYIVNETDNPVTLEVNAGAQGQTSDMTITLDDATIVKNLAGDFTQKPLGTNKQLNGKKLSIAATIADTSRQTNLTSLTIRLKGGNSASDFPLSKTVDEEGDSEDYLCIIEFFNPLI
jgi:hypothetical protein